MAKIVKTGTQEQALRAINSNFCLLYTSDAADD